MVIIIVSFIIMIILVSYFVLYWVSNCGEKKDFWTYMTDFSLNPCIVGEAPLVQLEKTIERKKEVFQIMDQVYNYEEAKCKCDAYGGRLATYEDLVMAYNEGANWKTYGWIEGGRAFKVLQKCRKRRSPFNWQGTDYDRTVGAPIDYDEQDTIEEPWLGGKHKHGVVGGYFPHKMRFGVYCFGVKPSGFVVRPVGKCPDGTCSERSMQVLESDTIAPLNKDIWSAYD